MDNLITLIVIVIAVWSLLSKFKAKQKRRQGATPSQGGWIFKLNAFLTDIKRQIEQQSKDRITGAGTSEWDRLLDGDEISIPPSDEDETGLDDWVLEEAESPRPKEMPPAAPARARATQTDKIPFVPVASQRKTSQTGQPSFTTTTVSRADLRKAVIWSEILGPPVALRDQHGDGRIKKTNISMSAT